MYLPKPSDPVLNSELDLVKGLVLAMPFNEYGSTIIKDLSGCHNDGTLLGGTSWVNSPFDHALDFDGTSGYVEMSDSPSLDVTTELTISVLVKATLAGGTDHITVSKWGTGGWRSWMVVIMPSGEIRLFTSSDGTGYYYGWTTTYRLAENTWYHIGATYRGGEGIKIYVNGDSKALTFAGTEGLPASLYNSITPVQLGRDYNDAPAGLWYKGLMDGLVLCGRKLNDAEIFKLYEDSFFMYRAKRKIYALSPVLPIVTAINLRGNLKSNLLGGFQQ